MADDRAVITGEAPVQVAAVAAAPKLDAIDDLRHEVEHLNKELDALSHTMNNQIRGELRGINVGIHDVLEESLLSEDGKAELLKVGECVHRITFMIDATLKLSHLTRRSLTLQQVDLSTLARTISADICRRSRKENVKVEVEDALIVFADPHLMELAVERLMDNAIRFAAQGKDPLVKVGKNIVNDKTTFFVQDNGPGFNQNLAGRIFEPVMRMNAEGGGGTGLAMVKRIIERHDGRVWAQGKPGQGATFTFVLGTPS